jgi:hypothetical protein
MVVFVCVYKSESLTTAFDKVRTSEESRKTTEKMKWSSTVSQTPAGVEKSVLKVSRLCYYHLGAIFQTKGDSSLLGKCEVKMQSCILLKEAYL